MNCNSKIQRGYSLLEVLIASAIFASVMAIGTTIFSVVKNVRTLALQTQELTEAGSFIAQTLSQAVRSASGARDAAQNFLAFPFSINVPAVQPGCIHNTYLAGSGLTVRFMEADQVQEESFLAVPAENGNLDLIKRNAQNNESSMLPPNITLKEFCILGIDYAAAQTDDLKGIQPFVIFQFTLYHQRSKKELTLRTAVSGREFF